MNPVSNKQMNNCTDKIPAVIDLTLFHGQEKEMGKIKEQKNKLHALR